MNYDFGVKDTGNWLATANGKTLEFSGLVRPTTDLEKQTSTSSDSLTAPM